MGKKEFDEELRKQFGNDVAQQIIDADNCKICGAETIHCPRCNEVICSKGCEEKSG